MTMRNVPDNENVNNDDDDDYEYLSWPTKTTTESAREATGTNLAECDAQLKQQQQQQQQVAQTVSQTTTSLPPTTFTALALSALVTPVRWRRRVLSSMYKDDDDDDNDDNTNKKNNKDVDHPETADQRDDSYDNDGLTVPVPDISSRQPAPLHEEIQQQQQPLTRDEPANQSTDGKKKINQSTSLSSSSSSSSISSSQVWKPSSSLQQYDFYYQHHHPLRPGGGRRRRPWPWVSIRNTLERRRLRRQQQRLLRQQQQQQHKPPQPERVTPWLIPAHHPWKTVWDICTVLVALLNAYLTHVAIRDRQFSTNASWRGLCDLWFVCDLLLNFVSQQQVTPQRLLTSVQSVWASYLTSWFVVDLIALLPVEVWYMQPIIERQNRRNLLTKSFFRRAPS